MSRSQRFDHAVILVRDLERATTEYARLGFTVTGGGAHHGGATRNALIAFADGSYLELLAFTRGFLWRVFPLGRWPVRGASGGADPLVNRFRTRASRGFGLLDFALMPESLDADVASLRREGVRVWGPAAGGRTDQSGEAVAWQVAVPAPQELPFLCADLGDRSLRVPGGEAVEHPNGVVGVARVLVAVDSVETSSARYRALLRMEPTGAATDELGEARTRIFRLPGCEVALVSSSDPGHPIRRRLREWGPGPASLTLQVDTAAVIDPFEPTVASGVRFDVIHVAAEPEG
jgi:hypothetical protein